MTLDLTSLVANVKDEAAPITRKGGAGRPAIDNPFGPVLLASWEAEGPNDKTGATKALTVTNDVERGKTGEPRNVTTIKGLIRRAADENGLGVQMVAEESKDGKKTTIRFAAKEKTLRTRQQENGLTEPTE